MKNTEQIYEAYLQVVNEAQAPKFQVGDHVGIGSHHFSGGHSYYGSDTGTVTKVNKFGHHTVEFHNREVLLHAHGTPLILARTIIPETTIKAVNNKLAHLGNRPLGEIIFSYPKLERVAMDVCLVKPQTWTDTALSEANIQHALWGRRTVYGIAHHQMLVSEFFLPAILERV